MPGMLLSSGYDTCMYLGVGGSPTSGPSFQFATGPNAVHLILCAGVILYNLPKIAEFLHKLIETQFQQIVRFTV